MLQVNLQDVCIFATDGYCYYLDVEEKKVREGQIKPDLQYDNVNMPALLTEAGYVVTGCSKTEQVVEFKHNRPFTRYCQL